MAGADVVLFDLDGDPPRRSEMLAEMLAASRSLAVRRANGFSGRLHPFAGKPQHFVP
jgi:hypothetical protein